MSNKREIVSVGLDGRSQPMYRYKDELHLPEHMRESANAEQRDRDEDRSLDREDAFYREAFRDYFEEDV